ncbi:hypothetical protein DERF_006276 [Dermatophagoides farinae]|uniref:Uncharacterized protein n=1 Tax=Dermatophagoides farinae TaxID=6954 RepID=A0A922I557_DERFA|nr:hypothetical protein DERF_006276 [Dermatophagoides farinae]
MIFNWEFRFQMIDQSFDDRDGIPSPPPPPPPRSSPYLNKNPILNIQSNSLVERKMKITDLDSFRFQVFQKKPETA